jgi:hypothetical protein
VVTAGRVHLGRLKTLQLLVDPAGRRPPAPPAECVELPRRHPPAVAGCGHVDGRQAARGEDDDGAEGQPARGRNAVLTIVAGTAACLPLTNWALSA